MPNAKRIAIFSITYDPFIGGAEVAIKEVTNRLPDFEFDLFTTRMDLSLPDSERIGNVNVFRVGTGRLFLDKICYPWRASRLAMKMHAQNPYSVIHAIMANYAGLSALLFKKRAPSVPYILTLQSGDSDWFIRMRTWFWHPWYCQIYTKADIITAISNWLKDRSVRYGYKGDIEIIPNGVDIEKFDIQISDEERASIRKSWGACENDFVVITTSRLVYKNGIDILIDAMEYLDDRVRLVIAGKGKDEEKLKAQSSKFKKRIVFLGHVSHYELPRLLKSSEMFVRPSRTEGMGNSFIEAKISGLIVLGTRVGGIKDLINAGIVDPIESTDAKAVAEKIKSAMHHNNQDISNQIKNKYSWDAISQQYKQEYQKLAK
ncbi:MAG: hypothetical protein COV79_02935 [Parcubacteria group bacterium CG11_big_fil_rev_8_21_14_0_20_41_14]|nr:MAG: hypothetical protein COW93_03505 [Parcubacteria group bacterium CG22_combo_CG10-13_8_21_14_all_41_9]PIQ79860.1 MAG: hypothetical protein COV79_02935 [Parcubacteria group bacterium CG11_big_fil_rev_8_21_14_0_20_41_14]